MSDASRARAPRTLRADQIVTALGVNHDAIAAQTVALDGLYRERTDLFAEGKTEGLTTNDLAEASHLSAITVRQTLLRRT